MTKAWPSVALGDIALITMGQSPPGETYNTAGEGLPFFQGKAEFRTDYPTTVKWCSAPQRTAIEGDILLSVRAPVGPTNIAAEKCCIGRGLAAIRAKGGKANTRFLRYFLRRFESDLARQGVGSTFSAINRRDIERMQLLLPPLDEQERIVTILDGVEELRCLREQADLRTADLIPALFYEMFGDPATNPKGWPTTTLGSVLILIKNGANISQSHERTGLPITRIETISNGVIDSSRVRWIVPEKSVLENHRLESGDILFSHINSIPHIAKTAIYDGCPETLIHGINLLLLRIDPKQASAPWLIQLLKLVSSRGHFRRICRRAVNQVSVNQQDVSAFKIVLPPLSRQKDFAARIAEIHAMEAQQAESRSCLDDLFQALLHRAFRGEL